MYKNILIAGLNSYIGVNVENYLINKDEGVKVTTFDTYDSKHLEKSFEGFDTVFHVAGIAHVSADKSKEELYYKINRDMAVETAKKAKHDGVKQFIFMSSIIVYGDVDNINKDTNESPVDFYGKSKLMAEEGICGLESDDFKVVIIRPPMIYGKGSKGNYPKLSKLASLTPIFPKVQNTRSMLHIDNLCELIYLIIKNEASGHFYPQNKEVVNTSELVKQIAICRGRKVILVPGFNNIIAYARKKIKLLNKMFGDLAYETEMSNHFQYSYCVVDFKESINRTEK